MSWHHEKSVTGWRVVFKDGAGAEFSFAPSQFGSVKFARYSGFTGGTRPFSEIQEHIDKVVLQLEGLPHRFGTAFSAKRGILCGQISSALNAAGHWPFCKRADVHVD